MATRSEITSLDGPMARRMQARLVGDGPELLVFAHGLGTDQSVWHGVLQTLPARFSALVFDLPGVGPSAQDEFDALHCRNLAPFADDLLGLLDELALTGCTVVSHSVSGMLTVLASIEAPERFARLIALNASPRYVDEPGYRGGFTAEVLAGQFEAMAADYQAWVAGFAQTVIPANAPAAVASFTGTLAAMRPDIAIAVARIIFESDMRPLLGSFLLPTVLIHSNSDPAVPPEVGRYLHARLPSSELVWIDVAGHLPHLSAPQEVAAVLWKHLA